jgi:hypothetical protein
MQELLVDFITSLDGYGAAEGWPDGGDWKDPSISPGSTGSRNGTTRS